MADNPEKPDYRERIDALAALMEEFRLSEATLEADGMRLAFRRRSAPRSTEAVVPVSGDDAYADEAYAAPLETYATPEAPKGTPVTSPMNGIFYASPSPSAPAFAKEGDQVTAGQSVGLIEAMKVFNEIPSPVSGTVLKVVAESGAVVQPGDVLLYIG